MRFDNIDKELGKISSDNSFYDVIQRAYQAFKQPPTNDHGVCDCCMDPEVQKDFFNHGQAGLPMIYLNDWFFAAADTPLNKSTWRFILPRVLEVLASGEDPSTTALEISLNRFPTGDPSNWNNEEWMVLDEFQRLFLSTSDLRDDDCLDDILCMFAQASWDINDLFTQILDWPTDKLVKKLWKDWCDFKNPNIWITAFWNSSTKAREFYSSEKMQTKVIDFALADNTPPELAEKAMAVSNLMQKQ